MKSMSFKSINGGGNITAILDPFNAFKNEDQNHLQEVVGILPLWLLDGGARPAKTIFEESYGFPVTSMRGGSVTENGVYSYPKDPDLSPIMTIKKQGETVHFYHYAMVTIVNDTTGDTLTTRMD